MNKAEIRALIAAYTFSDVPAQAQNAHAYRQSLFRSHPNRRALLVLMDRQDRSYSRSVYDGWSEADEDALWDALNDRLKLAALVLERVDPARLKHVREPFHVGDVYRAIRGLGGRGGHATKSESALWTELTDKINKLLEDNE